MSRLGINTGNNPNDGQGDPLRVAMGKINSNFLEIYNTIGDGFTLTSYASTAGVSTLAQNLTGSPRINVSSILNTGITTTEHIEVRNITSTGIVTAVQFVGDGSQLTNVTALVGGLEVLDDNVRKGVARELNFGANIISTGPDGVGRVTISVPSIVASATYADSAGISSYSEIAGIATLSANAGFAEISNTSNYSSNSGIATFASVAGVATESTTASFATIAGVSTVSFGITGTPSIIVGVVTADSYNGSGSRLTGVITSLVAGTNISILQSAGIATINSFGADGFFTGVVTATSFIGDGSGLTGIVGSGSGVIINDNGILVGTAGTINFGPNLTVSPISAGVVTVTASSGGESYWTQAASGIHTLSNVGIGTTAKNNYALSVSSGPITNGLTVDGFSIINNVRFGTTTQGFTKFLFPDFQNTVGGVGNGWFTGIQSTMLGDAPFQVINHAKFNTTLQIGTSFYDIGTGTPLYPGVFIDGKKSTISVGFGISLNGQSGIITATGFVGGDGRFSGVVTATRFESTSSGTPTIDSPNNLNINAINVAISTDVTVGRNIFAGINTSTGLILTSPNGSKYRLVVDNSGNLSTVLVP